jgi:hypothetical protein
MTFRKSAVSLAVAGGLGSTAAPALAVDIGGYGRLDVGLLYVDATPASAGKGRKISAPA